MRMIGYERNNFTIKTSGETITGYSVYLARAISAERGKGQAIERVYLSDRRIEENEINLAALYGKDVNVFYSRYGKVQNIISA